MFRRPGLEIWIIKGYDGWLVRAKFHVLGPFTVAVCNTREQAREVQRNYWNQLTKS